MSSVSYFYTTCLHFSGDKVPHLYSKGVGKGPSTCKSNKDSCVIIFSIVLFRALTNIDTESLVGSWGSRRSWSVKSFHTYKKSETTRTVVCKKTSGIDVAKLPPFNTFIRK